MNSQAPPLVETLVAPTAPPGPEVPARLAAAASPSEAPSEVHVDVNRKRQTSCLNDAILRAVREGSGEIADIRDRVRPLTSNKSTIGTRLLSLTGHGQLLRVRPGLYALSPALSATAVARPQPSQATLAPSVRAPQERADGKGGGAGSAWIDWHQADRDSSSFAAFLGWWKAFLRDHGECPPTRADWDAHERWEAMPSHFAPRRRTVVQVDPPEGLPSRMYRAWEVQDAAPDEFGAWFTSEYRARGNAPGVEDWRARNKVA